MKKPLSPYLVRWYALEVLKYSEKDLKKINPKELEKEVLYGD